MTRDSERMYSIWKAVGELHRLTSMHVDINLYWQQFLELVFIDFISMYCVIIQKRTALVNVTFHVLKQPFTLQLQSRTIFIKFIQMYFT